MEHRNQENWGGTGKETREALERRRKRIGTIKVEMDWILSGKVQMPGIFFFDVSSPILLFLAPKLSPIFSCSIYRKLKSSKRENFPEIEEKNFIF